jgi:hypothetical protein
MHVAHVVSPPRRRLLIVATLAAAAIAALAGRHAPPAPPPALVTPPIACGIPAVPPPAPVPALHFATPPPGDRYDRTPDLRATRIVEAVLIDGGDTNLPYCGVLMVKSAMTFHPLKPADDRELRVIVTCPAEQHLQRGHRYVLVLMPDVTDAGMWDLLDLHERGPVHRSAAPTVR